VNKSSGSNVEAGMSRKTQPSAPDIVVKILDEDGRRYRFGVRLSRKQIDIVIGQLNDEQQLVLIESRPWQRVFSSKHDIEHFVRLGIVVYPVSHVTATANEWSAVLTVNGEKIRNSIVIALGGPLGKALARQQ
jgi:hypothetical protein